MYKVNNFEQIQNKERLFLFCLCEKIDIKIIICLQEKNYITICVTLIDGTFVST